MGKQKITLDPNIISGLAEIHCTVQEIAFVLKCSKDTLERNYMQAIEIGRANGKSSLRRRQWELAQTGNATMLIWLGKQILQQRDKSPEEIDAEQNKTIMALTTQEKIALIRKAREEKN